MERAASEKKTSRSSKRVYIITRASENNFKYSITYILAHCNGFFDILYIFLRLLVRFWAVIPYLQKIMRTYWQTNNNAV